MVNETGTRLQCPCGEWVGLTIKLGQGQRKSDRSYVVPVSFDEQQFKADFAAHVLADPENEQHARFVVAVDG